MCISKINMKNHYRRKYIADSFYLWPGVFTVVAMGAILCVFGFITPNHEAGAFTTKSPGQGLAPDEWNSLPNDFVDKTGDTMAGNLSLGGNGVINLPDPNNATDAANKQWVDSEIAGVFTSMVGGEARTVTGAHLGIACGSSPVSTSWAPYPTASAGVYISTYIDTTSAGFGATPYYFTAIRGNGSEDSDQWRTMGPNAIFAPTQLGFIVVLRVDILGVSTAAAAAIYANNHGWRIDWCGAGN